MCHDDELGTIGIASQELDEADVGVVQGGFDLVEEVEAHGLARKSAKRNEMAPSARPPESSESRVILLSAG